MKKFLFVMRHPPQAGLRVRETLDLILTTAAFDQPVTLLFLDDGVYQLQRDQNPSEPPQVAPLFAALELYGVEHILVEAESLAERGLTLADLILPAASIPRTAIAALISGHEVVV